MNEEVMTPEDITKGLIERVTFFFSDANFRTDA